jgi:hypothetical protein
MSIGLSEVDHRRDIIVARNLLTPPALLLGKKIIPDAASLLDFCTLINALMLHDRLVTFNAKCPDEILDLSLYTYLKEKGILVELDTSSRHRNELTIQWIMQFVDKKATNED